MPAYFIVRAELVDTAVKNDFDRWYQEEHLADARQAFKAKRAFRGWSEREQGAVGQQPSVEIPRPGLQPPQQRTLIGQAPGEQMHHRAVAFDDAIHAEQPRGGQHPVLALGEPRRHDHIEKAGFILERDKHHPLGRFRALAMEHQPRRRRGLAVSALP